MPPLQGESAKLRKKGSTYPDGLVARAPALLPTVGAVRLGHADARARAGVLEPHGAAPPTAAVLVLPEERGCARVSGVGRVVREVVGGIAVAPLARVSEVEVSHLSAGEPRKLDADTLRWIEGG